MRITKYKLQRILNAGGLDAILSLGYNEAIIVVDENNNILDQETDTVEKEIINIIEN